MRLKISQLFYFPLFFIMLGMIPNISRVYALETNTTLYLGSVEKTLETGESKVYYSLGNTTVVRNIKADNSSTVSYLHTDHLGSTILITNDKGNVEGSTLAYYPYGNEVNPLLSTTDNYYTGQKKDSSSDLYYYNARYYNPKIGHFISADKAEGDNRYAYVANNPIMLNDPSGNRAWQGDEGGSNSNWTGANYFSNAWHSFADPISQDWQYLMGGYGSIGERTVAAADLLTLGGLRNATFAMNNYVAVNAMANEQGLSMFDPARVAAAANAGIAVTSLSASITGYGQALKAAPEAISGLKTLQTSSKILPEGEIILKGEVGKGQLSINDITPHEPGYNMVSYRKLRELIKEGVELDPVRITVVDGKVVTTDGFNRIVASLAEGKSNVPYTFVPANELGMTEYLRKCVAGRATSFGFKVPTSYTAQPLQMRFSFVPDWMYP